MDTANFLRALANVIDAAQNISSEKSDGAAVQSSETDVMVPPLQQELELMKKIANVESVYDGCECGQENCECEKAAVESDSSENVDDELTVLKKNAGLGLGLSDDKLEG